MLWLWKLRLLWWYDAIVDVDNNDDHDDYDDEDMHDEVLRLIIIKMWCYSVIMM